MYNVDLIHRISKMKVISSIFFTYLTSNWAGLGSSLIKCMYIALSLLKVNDNSRTEKGLS